MRSTLLAAALLISGTASAQSWEQFLGSNPWFPNALPAGHGLATDQLGRVYVTALNAPQGTNEFAHFYSLDASGNHAWMWGLIGNNGQPVFESRGLDASNGSRIAWFERTSQSFAETDDVIYMMPPGAAQPQWERRYERDVDSGVLAVGSDGNYGAIVARRSLNFGGAAYAIENLGPSGDSLWTQLAPGCPFSTEEFLAMRVTDGWFTTVEVLSRCAAGPGGSDELVFQRLTADGYPMGPTRRITLPPYSPTLSDFGVSNGGRWVFTAEAPWGTEFMTLGAHDGWPHPIPPAPQPLVDVNIVTTGSGQLIAATGADGGTSLLFVDEYGAYSNWIETGVLTTPTPNTHWFADAGNYPVAAFVAEAFGQRFVHMLGFDENGGVAWKRNIYGVPPGAEPQFAAAANGEVVLAVDRIDTDGTHGVHVEQFTVGTPTGGPGGCLDGFCWK